MSKKTGTKKKQTKHKEKQQGFNDLLIPMLLILCIMPFIVRLALYSCGYAKYPWYSDEDVIMDLYSYYRCYFFEVFGTGFSVLCGGGDVLQYSKVTF